MFDPILFHISGTEPGLIVKFMPERGVRTKGALAVIVLKASDFSYLASTGFDADICASFEMMLKSGIGFAGRLRRDDEVVGDIHFVTNDNHYYLYISLDHRESLIHLLDSDVSELVAAFNHVGGTHVAPAH